MDKRLLNFGLYLVLIPFFAFGYKCVYSALDGKILKSTDLGKIFIDSFKWRK